MGVAAEPGPRQAYPPNLHAHTYRLGRAGKHTPCTGTYRRLMGIYSSSPAVVAFGLLPATPPSKPHMLLGHMTASLLGIDLTRTHKTMPFPRMALCRAPVAPPLLRRILLLLVL